MKHLEAPERRFADLGGPVHYLEWDGPGERTFVLVHGLGGSHANWMTVGPALARRGRVLAPDLPGFGRTPLAGRGTTLAEGRRALSAFVREVAGGRMILGGNSMGGALAMLQAALEPGSVEGLVLTCPVLPPSRDGHPAPLAVFGFSLYRIPVVGEWVVRQRLRRLSPERQVRLAFRILAGDPSSIGEDVVEAQVEMVREHLDDPDAVAAFVQAARSLLELIRRSAAYRELMGRIECPVLLLHGRRDPLVPAAYAEAVAREHPDWRVRIFPDLGHIPQLEAPDRWLTAVDDWLARTPGAAPRS